MRRAFWRDRHIALVALGAGLVVLAIVAVAVALILAARRPAGTEATDGDGVQVVLNTLGAAATPTPPPAPTTTAPTTSPTAQPPAPQSTTADRPAPQSTESTAPPRDEVAPSIGEAVASTPGIWTDYWCSAGPIMSEIQIPVHDATDPTNQLQVVVRFVLRRSDTQATVDMGQVQLPSGSSPFTVVFGPYPGPRAAYAYDNVIDMTVSATDPANNTATRTFISFLTFNDCKAGE